MVPPASAAPIDKCTAVLPVAEFDAVGCVGQVLDQVPDCHNLACTQPVWDAENLVVDPLCPYERFVYDDVVGGPASSLGCLHGEPPR